MGLGVGQYLVDYRSLATKILKFWSLHLVETNFAGGSCAHRCLWLLQLLVRTLAVVLSVRGNRMEYYILSF